MLFRIAITNGFIMAISVIITAVVLYRMLNPVNKTVAMLGLCLRLVEAALIVGIELAGFMALQILNGKESLRAFTPEQLQIPIGFFLNIHTILYCAFPMLFIGLGLTAFNYLFYESNYIPRLLAGFGMLSYFLIFIYALIAILVPKHPMAIQIICLSPSILFEIILGLWLLVKGVNVQLHKNPTIEFA